VCTDVFWPRKLQLAEVPVIVLDHLTESQKRAYILADNQLALNAGWDESLLAAELVALQNEDFNLGLIGFEDEELARRLSAQDTADGITDEDAVPELQATPISVLGDLWILGGDRLLVGGATNTDAVAKLMAGAAANLVFTDPPFNVDYEGYTKDRLKIQGDRMSDADFKQFLEATFRSYRSMVKPGASMYVCHSSSWQREFQNALESAGFEVRCQIIWAKNTFAWASAATNSSTSQCSIVMSPAQKIPGTGTRPSRHCGKKKSPRRTVFTLRLSPLS
jgi:hypothetical protein